MHVRSQNLELHIMRLWTHPLGGLTAWSAVVWERQASSFELRIPGTRGKSKFEGQETEDHVVVTSGSGFGEIGHWRITRKKNFADVKIPDAPKPKRCCEHWEKRTEVNTSALIATSCRSPTPLKHRLCLTNRSSTMTNALMQQPLSNICRIFFTKRLFFSGKFAANPAVWANFYDGVIQQNTVVNMPLPELIAGPRSR